MPELPEVETVVRDVRPLLLGRRLLSIATGKRPLRRAWNPGWSRRLRGRCIEAVRRRGKWILVDLDDGLLVVHLGMTGQLTVGPADRALADHTHLRIGLDDGGELRFRDVRRFGSVTVFAHAADLDEFLAGRLGPEPWDLATESWFGHLTHTARCLKAVLLDQRVVAGVGNIYADESLYAARLPPMQRGCDTTRKEAERLRKAIPKVLATAIERRGSSIRNYVGGSGLRGSYQDEFRAYGRTGKPCRRCRTPIERIRLAGRSTHYCPKCQGTSLSPLPALRERGEQL